MTDPVDGTKTPSKIPHDLVSNHHVMHGYGWNLVRRDLGTSFIGIAGIIGAGKTTLSERLAKRLGLRNMTEAIGANPYLSLFYQDMEKYGYPMQTWLLHTRFVQHQEIIWNTNQGAVQDRTIYEDPIFAKMLWESGKITDLDYLNYTKLFQTMMSFLRKPDVIIFLDIDPGVAVDRITKRGRECEKNMELDYLVDLKRHYKQWCLEASNTVPVIILDWNCPLETDTQAYDNAVEVVIEKLVEMAILQPLGNIRRQDLNVSLTDSNARSIQPGIEVVQPKWKIHEKNIDRPVDTLVKSEPEPTAGRFFVPSQ